MSIKTIDVFFEEMLLRRTNSGLKKVNHPLISPGPKLPVCEEGEEHHIHDQENGKHEALAGPVQQRGLREDDHDNVAKG